MPSHALVLLLTIMVAGCADSTVGPAMATCRAGTATCGSRCVDLDSDPSHCGECGNRCAPGEVCSGSECAGSCAAGLADCDGACVDIDSHDLNCGSCGTACPGTTACNS